MHRHVYQGRKLSLKQDQRQALIRGLVTSLVLHERIETTLPKAKEVAPEFDRLVTKAKQNTLHSQRQIRSVLLTEAAAQKLTTELAPALADRQSGYSRIIKTGFRQGDNAPLAVLSVILPPAPVKPEASVAKSAKAKPAADKDTDQTAADSPAPAKVTTKTARKGAKA